MAQIKRVAKEQIEKARQLLLSEIFSEQTNDRFVKREAIKQLLGPLIAARENGLSFEEITTVFAKAGLELSPTSLRSYYFELKTADELAREARRHADKITKAKAEIDRRFLEIHNTHGQSVAVQYAHRITEKPILYTALEQAVIEKEELFQIGNKATSIMPVSIRTKESSNTSVSTRIRQTGSNTIEAIETASLATEERTTLKEDVVLKNGKVFYTSGQAFHGYLSKKQLHLLRSIGKVLAPTLGQSSNAFVSMPPKL